VVLVDTPGTGSVYAHNTVEAGMALETMDAAVFVLTADPPVSASERDLMSRVAGLSVSMFVVLNKADYLDADTEVPGHPAEHLLDGHATSELAEAVEFTAAVAAEAAR
jgi:GTPase Era involved in 16S rRNA processing